MKEMMESRTNNNIEEQSEAEKQPDQSKKKTIAVLWQFIKFGLVGVSNTVVSYVTYSICYYLFHTNVHVANIIGFIISVLNAYIWQSKFVFKESEEGEHRVWWQVLIKTYISYAFSGLFLTEILLFLWLNLLHIEQYLDPMVNWMVSFGFSMKAKDAAVSLAPFLNMVITIPINFCVNKFWAYRQKKEKA